MPRKSIPLLAFAMPPADSLTGVAEWVHLLTRGKNEFRDGRTATIIYDGGDVPMVSYDGKDVETRIRVDVNHSNVKSHHTGVSTPAVGWITALAARDDGLWGQVEWNDEGKRLLEQKAYRAISPEIYTDPETGRVVGLFGAALTNLPALKSLTPLFLSAQPLEGDTMEKFLKLLCATLGLAETSTEDQVQAAVKTLAETGKATALQLSALAEAVGAAQDAKPEVILAAAQKLKTADGMVPVTAVSELQTQFTALSAEYAGLKSSIAKEKAEAFIASAIKDGRVGVAPLREHYIKRHMASAEGAAQVETEINALPKLAGNNTILPATPPENGVVTLSAQELHVAKLLGQDPEAMKKTKEAEKLTALAA